MPKAIVITEENRTDIEKQYNLEIDMLKGWEGLTLVADFGQSGLIHGWLNEVAFNKSFVKTGKKLENGYFEVARIQ